MEISKENLESIITQSNNFTNNSSQSIWDQSKAIDKYFGFHISKIEQKLLKKYRAYYKTSDQSNRKQHFGESETWIGLHPQVLLTPYAEIYEFLNLLKKYNPKKIVDFGAAYGRVGIVMNSIYQDATFTGYEIIQQRVDEANRIFEKLNFKNCEMIKENILDENFNLPDADIYFIYDFSNPIDISRLLNKLSDIIFKKRFFIVAKGEGIKSLIQLKYPQFWASHGVIHKKHWSIYSSFCDLI